MIYVISVAFNRASLVAASIAQFYKETRATQLPIHHLIVDCHYPLPSVAANARELEGLAHKLDGTYLKLERNFGQDGNFNKVHEFLIKEWGLGDKDILVYWDCDHKFTSQHWLGDAVHLIEDFGFDFVTTGCMHTLDGVLTNIADLQGPETQCDWVRVRRAEWPGGYPIAIWTGKFAKCPIVPSHSYYGGTEYNTLQVLKKIGGKGGVMMDHLDKRDLKFFDPEYTAWKHDVIAKPVHEDFAEWLKKRS